MIKIKEQKVKKYHCAIVLSSVHFQAHSSLPMALWTVPTPYKSIQKWARLIFWLIYRPTEAVFPWHIIALKSSALTGHKRFFFFFFFKAKLLLILCVTHKKCYNETDTYHLFNGTPEVFIHSLFFCKLNYLH